MLMNKTISNTIRQSMKKMIIHCNDNEQLLFKRMYSHNNLNLHINDVIDNMPDDKINMGFTQIENTLKKKL